MTTKPIQTTAISVIKIQSEADLQEAFAIRREVFMKGQGVSLEDEYDGFDKSSQHYLGFVNDKPAGTARWRRTGEGIKLERFCVLPAFRRQGLAAELLKSVMADILGAKKSGEKIYLHAQMEVIPLYEAAGFEKVGIEFLECNISHQTMEYPTIPIP